MIGVWGPRPRRVEGSALAFLRHHSNHTAMTPVFWQRDYPHANAVLLPGPRPILVDTGFGPGAPGLLAWLAQHDVVLGALRVFNTHAHSDHVGGNAALARLGVPNACSVIEAKASAGPDACRARYLAQPIEAYVVSATISPGAVLETGASQWVVIPTPGHTAGHCSLTDGATLVLGDALHGADIGWLDIMQDGPSALDAAADSIERLAALPAHVGYSGHGPAITDIPAAIARARRRIARWRADPEQVLWHACKRIFSHMLMLEGGLTEAALATTLMPMPWFRAHADLLDMTEEAFVTALMRESVRADAVAWQDGLLVATASYDPPRPHWAIGPTRPSDWPSQSSFALASPVWR